MRETLLTVVFGAGVALMVIGAILMSWLYRRLEDRHYEVWDRLGQPSLFLNASARIQQRVARFLWHKEYAELGDETLSKVASLSKVLTVVTGTLIVVLFILILGVL